MKKLYSLFIGFLLLLSFQNVQATTWNITTPGLTYSPATLTVNLGDTIVFDIDNIHNAVEVTQATWNSNGTTSNGGFNIPLGGGTVVMTVEKTYYYVCQPHAAMGMKGQIIVIDATGIPTVNAEERILKFHPNPATNATKVFTGINRPAELIIYNMIGKAVYRKQDVRDEDLLDISALNKGVYLIEIKSQDYKRTGRLVISE